MITRKTKLLSIFIVAAILLSACSLDPIKSLMADPTEQPQVVETAEPTQPSTETNSATIEFGSLAAYGDALEEIYARVNPSVVNIQVTERARVAINNSTENPFANIPGFEFYFGSPNSPDMQIPDQPGQQTQALGSGFVWNKDGYIVTNNHVVEDAEKIQVKFSDGTIANAKVVGTDVNSDLAVIQLVDFKGELYPITSSDSEDVNVGQLAIAIGNPYGLANTMTVGIVSAIGRSLATDQTSSTSGSFTIPNIIQTDAPINPGNSGGVLINDQGQLIGVTTAIESSSGANAGIGFAVPSNTVNKIVPKLIKSGKYEHPYLGLTGTTLTPDLASAMELENTQRGILVIEVAKDGPADKAGLLGSSKNTSIEGISTVIGGDVIIAIDNQKLSTIEDLISFLSSRTEVGQNVRLTLLRDGSEKIIEVELAARPGREEHNTDMANLPSQDTLSSTAWLGVAATAMTPEIASQMDLPKDQKGILLQAVVKASPADEAGLIGSYKPVIINSKRVLIGGDIITEIDGQVINTVAALQHAIADKKPGDQIQLTYLRDGETESISIILTEKPAN